MFGGSAEGWLVQQAQYELAHVRTGRLKLKRLEFPRAKNNFNRFVLRRAGLNNEPKRSGASQQRVTPADAKQFVSMQTGDYKYSKYSEKKQE